MSAARVPSAASRFALLQTLSGFAAAVVPIASVVHVLVEAFALRGDVLPIEFTVRHLYLMPLSVCCAWWFSATVGLGSRRSEMTRRCAIVRARLRGPKGQFRFTALLAANCGFFAVTQAIEGFPIVAAPLHTLALCLTAAALGSLLAALLVFRLGPALLAAALVAITFLPRPAARPRFRCAARHFCARHASLLFSLFRPKRPPPRPSLA